MSRYSYFPDMPRVNEESGDFYFDIRKLIAHNPVQSWELTPEKLST